MTFTFIADLIELSCAEIEVEMTDIHEVHIDAAHGIWSVLIPERDQEVFFWSRDGHPHAYHVNDYNR